MRLILTFIFVLSQCLPAIACGLSRRELHHRLRAQKPRQVKDVPDSSGITRKEFYRIIDSVRRVYAPIFKQHYMKLQMTGNWNDETMNAYAAATAGERHVILNGGYARHPLMTEDGFLSVVCHEIGHHLGGFPKKSSASWSSSEGEADYFSTLKCMREVLGQSWVSAVGDYTFDLPVEVVLLCKTQFPDDPMDEVICRRSAKAAEDHGRVIADIDGKGTPRPVSLMTPSTLIVSETNLKWPDAQCRIDTKLQGALCSVLKDVPLEDEDETSGACHSKNVGFELLGARPKCWFVERN